MELEHWESRLQDHFLKLRDQRRTREGGHQLFALEHGLEPHDISSLAVTVREHVVKNKPLRKHPLAWMVYATELGYGYSGGEYWQTFESETPGWDTYGSRYWILDCFEKFHKEFVGAKPSGRWAEHFRIICWPITHAILPRDLQFQLAQILYDLRHSFSSEILASPSKLGALISTRSWNTTSRFQQLAQEPLLLGQIALALILVGHKESASLIYPSTLLRIAKDLDRERLAREWLHRARRVANERVQVRGMALVQESIKKVTRSEQARAEVAALGLEPRLVLCPTEASLSSWKVMLEIPDLSNLLLKFPLLREILVDSRCVVAGTEGRPISGGRFLHGQQRLKIVRWPMPEEVLLQFERKDPQLDYLLRTECLLRPGKTWLFRIASDGLAYELRSLRVRPGEKYIVITSDGFMKGNRHQTPVKILCSGVSAVLLDVPSAVTQDWQETIKSLGLLQSRQIEVWPAGLAAQVWDGEGRGEWLASERPCLALSVDHVMDSLHVSIDESTEPGLEITPIVPGQPVFIELPQLPVGLHTVRISARLPEKTDLEPLGDVYVLMQIRQARSWKSGPTRGPVFVQMDPVSPSLEELWEGRVNVRIYGPAGRNIKCRVSLFEKATDTPLLTKVLQPISLPTTAEDWWMRFDRDFRRTAEAQYDSASMCELHFTAEELGKFNIQCEREFTPLRWVLKRRGHDQIIRLIDDSGNAEPPIVTRFAFETPSKEEGITGGPEYEVPAKGGLYVARIARFTAALLAPPTVHAITDLKCIPQIESGRQSIDALIHFLELANLWGHARLPGDIFSSTRKRDVLLALTTHISSLLGGQNWKNAEETVRRGQYKNLSLLSRAVSNRPEQVAIPAVLYRDSCALAAVPIKERIERVASLLRRFLPLTGKRLTVVSSGGKVVQRTEPSKIEDPRWLVELALRLASDPTEVKAWAGAELQAGLARLLEMPVIARAARFLVIATVQHIRHLETTPTGSATYVGWEWP